MTKKILAITLTAIFAVGLVSAAYAVSTIPGLASTKIKIDDDEYEKIKFKLDAKLKDFDSPFGGYAVLTSGDVIAVTSHAQFYDSETQDEPTMPVLQQVGAIAALCDPADTGCGGEWHTHGVKPVETELCGFAAVGALTFEEIADEVKVKAMKIVLKEIESDDDFTDAVSGNEQEYVFGDPVGNAAFDLVAVDSDGVFIGESGNPISAICIVP